MLENLVPMVVMTGMFAMIFGIVYIRSRENMAMIEKGLNPRLKDVSPRPFANLKWGLLFLGAGVGLLFAYIIDRTMIDHSKAPRQSSITIGGHRSGKKHSLISVSVTTPPAKDTTSSAVGAKADSVAPNTGNDNDNNIDDQDDHSITEIRGDESETEPLYFALVAIGGGLGLFFSYRIEKKEWLDKKIAA